MGKNQDPASARERLAVHQAALDAMAIARRTEVLDYVASQIVADCEDVKPLALSTYKGQRRGWMSS
jgi:hypothetical protein